jgi:hypothetical protein
MALPARLLALLLPLPLTPAQEAPAPPPPAAEARVYDFVAAMVGTKAILASQVTEAWREALANDAARPPELQNYSGASPAKRHALWGHLLETLVAREITAQSARLMGRSPDEIEAHVQRLVQDEIAKRAEDAGGLNSFSRHLGAIGRSMGTEAEDIRAEFLRSMAYYQGVLRELHDQRALLATPREMKALFEADPRRFDRPGSVRLAVARLPRVDDPAAADAEAAAVAARWQQLPRPVDEATMRAQQAHVVEVAADQGTPALAGFAAACRPGDVSPPTVDGGWVLVMLCLARVETKRADFRDPQVQEALRKEVANRHWDQVASRLFPENRVGVRRLPWGEPGLMERPRRD